MDDVEYELGDDVFNEETESAQSDGSPDDATPSNDYSPIEDDLVAEEKKYLIRSGRRQGRRGGI